MSFFAKFHDFMRASREIILPWNCHVLIVLSRLYNLIFCVNPALHTILESLLTRHYNQGYKVPITSNNDLGFSFIFKVEVP